MSVPAPTWVVSALLADDLLALNRALGILRRRNLPMSGVSLAPTGRPGTLRLTCLVTSDAAAAERTANALRKVVDVREVALHPEGDCTIREHVLVRVRVTPAQLPPLLDAISLYTAQVVEESPQDLLLEATGSAPFMTSFLRALEPFGILDLARGGTVCLPGRPTPDPAATPRPSSARMATAVPA
jgi:acetolactate synthase-1/3 small subunit